MFGTLGPTPYNFFNSVMSCNTVTPVGQQASQNWGRFCDQKATTLLSRFAAATTHAKQVQLSDALQARFAALAPIVPINTSPDWGEFNSTRFTGFPSARNPYATGQSRYAGAVIVLTTVRPVKGK